MRETTYTPNSEDAKELERYKREIRLCLVHYGSLSEEEASQMVDSDKLLEVKNDTQLLLIFHEDPYYWAMRMLYAQSNPLWYQDLKLWPPPDDYGEWSRDLSENNE